MEQDSQSVRQKGDFSGGWTEQESCIARFEKRIFAAGSGIGAMKKGFGPRNTASLSLLTALVVLHGCGQRSSIQALFAKQELLSCRRLAVLGLTPEQEQLLMAQYSKTFSVQMVTFVERTRLADIVGEQDLLAGRLNENTRAKIKRILGVEALLMCTYYDADAAGGKKLRVRIVDSETGAIIGSVISVAPDNFMSHSSMAITAIWNELMGKDQLEPVERKKSLPRRI